MIFEKIAAHPPARTALDDPERQIPYGALPAEIELHATRLLQSNVEVLGLLLDNGIDWVLWDLAALKCNIVCVPIPPFFSTEQRNHAIARAGITHLATPDGLAPTGLKKSPLIPKGTAKITFTSGTTGTPKGVCLPQKAMENVAASIVEVLGTDLVGIHACVLPLAVLLENVAGVYADLMAGCSVHLTPLGTFGQNYSDLHAVLGRLRANSAILVPEILRSLLAQMPQSGPLPDLKFVAVGGSKIDPNLIGMAHQAGLPVFEGYGLSECASVIALNTPDAAKTGTTGKLLPHVTAEIANDEIIVSNPGFLGYLGEAAPEKFATGDLGEIDPDGFVHITGRRKNVLITSYGRNISPEWIEAALLARPEVLQVMVYGDGDPALSALIVPTAANADIDSAIKAVNAALPDYARIANFRLVPPFTPADGTLTGTGRPRRQAISQKYGLKPTQETLSMNFYDRLVGETAAARQELYGVAQLTDGLAGNISRETYIAYLTEAYHHVKHTVPFLMAMGSRLPDDKRWLHKAIIEYLEEEEGHELWILNDIEAAGGDREKARLARPNLATQMLVSYNYDYIARKNPVGFLGMVFMLESTSTQIASHGAEAVKTGLDLPESAFSYLFSHGALDVEHMKFFEKTVNKVTDPEDQAAIIEVAQNTFRLFAGVFAAIPHDRSTSHAA